MLPYTARFLIDGFLPKLGYWSAGTVGRVKRSGELRDARFFLLIGAATPPAVFLGLKALPPKASLTLDLRFIEALLVICTPSLYFALLT